MDLEDGRYNAHTGFGSDEGGIEEKAREKFYQLERFERRRVLL